jgi:hypothetical protein
LSWKIAEAKAMKNHKKTKKMVQYPCFSYELEMCLCCNKCGKLENTKKGEDLLAFGLLRCLCLSWNDTCAAAWKIQKTKKRDVYMLEYEN